MDTFSDLGLPPGIAAGLASLGFTDPTKVQKLAIPTILGRKDLFIQSETGTGKTFAYLAPAMANVMELDPSRGPLVLVVCPTQELAVQVARQAELLVQASGLGMQVLSLLGGSPLSRQEAALKKKPHIVVGTPGRIHDLAAMRSLSLHRLSFLVLDEADRLFSKEYREELLSLTRMLPRTCVKILASATISASTRRLAADFMQGAAALDLLDEGVLSRDIEHWVFYVDHRKRLDFLRRLEAAVHPERCLVFASTGERVARAAERLDALGLPVDAILARQEKEHRRVSLERFEKGSLRYLVTTDLAARGLDIGRISHVISLDFPEDTSWYIHRAGRTGRAGEKGISILLADGHELRGASKIAVERNFVFRTKMLDSGQVVEPPVEDFFDMVEKGEEEKREYRAKRAGRDFRPGK